MEHPLRVATYGLRELARAWVRPTSSNFPSNLNSSPRALHRSQVHLRKDQLRAHPSELRGLPSPSKPFHRKTSAQSDTWPFSETLSKVWCSCHQVLTPSIKLWSWPLRSPTSRPSPGPQEREPFPRSSEMPYLAHCAQVLHLKCWRGDR